MKLRMILPLLLLCLPGLAGCQAAADRGLSQLSDAAGGLIAEQQVEEPEAVSGQSASALSLYAELSGEEQQMYDGMYAAIVNLEAYTYYAPDGQDEYSEEIRDALADMCTRILCDHPEIYWTAGSSTIHFRSPNVYTWQPDYFYTAGEAEAYTAETDAAIDSLLAGVTAESDFDRAVWAYEWIIRNTDYDTSLAEGELSADTAAARGAPGVFLDGRSVCSGYAKAFQLLMQRMEIPCTYVTGVTEQGQAHAWNIILLDGGTYHIDVTWDDPSFDSGAAAEGCVSHRYFGLTDGEILSGRTMEHADWYPACTATACNYFIRTGRYLEELNDDRVGSIVQAAQEDGAGSAEIRFASAELLAEATARYIENGVIFSLAPELGDSVWYYADETSNVLSIYFSDG